MMGIGNLTKAVQLPKGVGFMMPMHEYKYTDGKKQIKFPQIIEPKLDGIRCMARVAKDNVQLFSRFGLIKFPDVQADIYSKARTDSVYYVDGELVSQNMDFSEIMSIKNTRSPIRKIAKKLNEVKVFFYAFDLITEEEIKNIDRMLTLTLRKRRLMDWIDHNKFDNLRLVPFQDVYTNDNIEKLYKHFRENGFEGCVIKDPDGLYYCGKRRIDWRKRKDQETADLVVKGVYKGTKGYAGMVGGLYVEGFCPHKQRYFDLKVSSGIKMEQRSAWKSDPSSIIGKVVEVRYQSVTKKGSLYHPSLVCIREDRNPSEILINKLVRRY